MLSSFTEKTVHLEITSRCRIACLKCSRTWHQHNKTPFFSIADIDINIIKKYAALDYVRYDLCGNWGDPIYHPKFLTIVKILKEAGKKIYLFTNGSGKKDSWWHILFSLLDNNDVIFFAVDGLEDTSGIYRVNFTEKDFWQVMNLLKIANHQYNLNAIWTFIPFRHNEHQVEEAKKRALDMDVMLCIRKSSRWTNENDPLMPINPQLYSTLNSYD